MAAGEAQEGTHAKPRESQTKGPEKADKKIENRSGRRERPATNS